MHQIYFIEEKMDDLQYNFPLDAGKTLWCVTCKYDLQKAFWKPILPPWPSWYCPKLGPLNWYIEESGQSFCFALSLCLPDLKYILKATGLFDGR